MTKPPGDGKSQGASDQSALGCFMAEQHSLTHARLRELLHYDADLGWFMRLVDVGPRPDHKAGATPGHHDKRDGYLTITIDGVKHQAHRIAWFYVTKKWPAEEVDHRDTRRDNNAFTNLRLANDAINAQNRTRARKDSKTGVQGVSPHWNKFRALLRFNGKQRHLGLFPTQEAAHAAYLEAKRLHHPGNTL